MLPQLPLLLLPLPLPSGDAHVPVLPTLLVCLFLHRHTSEAAATCDYSSSRQAAAVHPLNKHANECLFYISVTFCPGESSYSPTPTPTVRPSGRATRTHVPVPHRDVTIRRLFLFFFLGGAKWCRRAPLHLQPPRTTSPHALFISVHGFVIDSFFYPVAAIFHMAYLDAAPPRG